MADLIVSDSFDRFRPYALRALVAPAAFGFCSIVAMVTMLAASHELNLKFANAPLVGAGAIFTVIAIYFLPGLFGAWIAVEILKRVESRVLNTQSRRDFAVRAITAMIVFGSAFIVCTAVQFKIPSRAEEWWPVVVAVSFVAAAFAAAVTYALVRTLQQHFHAEPR